MKRLKYEFQLRLLLFKIAKTYIEISQKWLATIKSRIQAFKHGSKAANLIWTCPEPTPGTRMISSLPDDNIIIVLIV